MSSITCGNCGNTHQSVQAVRECYAVQQPMFPGMPAEALAPTVNPCDTPEAGMYRNPISGAIYKVYKTVHGAGKMCAKEVLITDDSVEFVYRGLAHKLVSAENRMTLEQAREFGAIYGVCCVCGRTLTDEDSIANGIGPVCAEKI